MNHLNGLLLRLVLACMGLGAVPAFAAATFVQGNGNKTVNGATVTTPYSQAQTAGNLNVVVIGFANSTTTVSSVTDSRGNTYALAIGPTRRTGSATQYIYYAKNIVAAAAGANVVTVVLSSSSVMWPEVGVAEYGGLDTTSPLDVTAGSSGSSNTSSSGNLTTTHANDLIFAANYVENLTTGAGSGYTSRLIYNGAIMQDRSVTSVGTYSASAPIDVSGWWVMQAVAFKVAGTGGDTQAPTVPSNFTATAVSPSQVNLSWTASTDNVGVTGYQVERCQGASCPLRRSALPRRRISATPRSVHRRAIPIACEPRMPSRCTAPIPVRNRLLRRHYLQVPAP